MHGVENLTNGYQGRRVLVTGGAGFIGSHLIEDLVQRGAEVTALDDLSSGCLNNLEGVSGRIVFFRMDLAKDDLQPLLAHQEFTHIFHVAAHASIPASVERPRLDFDCNVLSTINLLEAVRNVSPQSIILHTSSAAIYGSAGDSLLREDSPKIPGSPYAVSKLASEHYVAVYARLYGIRAAILRLFPAYGPRLRKQVIYDFLCKVRDNPAELVILGDGSQTRDFNYVANVTEAYSLIAMRSPLRGEAYNVAAEESVTIDGIARMICARLKVNPRFSYTGADRAGDMKTLRADISRLKSLGYQARVDLATGLDQTVQWFEAL